MIGPFRRKREATRQAVSEALNKVFNEIEHSEDARMMRLIEEMKRFEGTEKGEQ